LDLFRYDGRPIEIKEVLSTINGGIKSPINRIAIEPEERRCLPIPELVGSR
jgi:hypothetical protein